MEPEQSEVEVTRARYTAFLAENPNYFGNLADSPFEPVEKMTGNKRYEELTCIGLNPRLDLLEATIQVKLPYGYRGDLCRAGSYEYVRFYLSYDEGATWEDAGLVAVNVHDIPDRDDCADRPTKPLTFVLTQPIVPRRDSCKRPVLPLVRGILSWEWIPPANDPGWLPPWGNRLDRHVQIRKRVFKIAELPKLIGSKVKLPPELEVFAEQPLPLPEPPEATVKQLVKLYGQASEEAGAEALAVEPKRFGAKELEAVTKSGSIDSQVLDSAIAQWEEVGLSWSETVQEFGKLSDDVTYEELNCLGLDYNREHLVATFVIKRPTGYSGNLCSAGSTEYVAFWVDWEDQCEWTYLDTVAVKVYDFAQIPNDGLHYAAILKVDPDKYRKSCKKPVISRIRAVLSWNTPPSTVDADEPVRWGNRLDTHVLIKPGRPFDGKGKITILGGVGVGDIHVATSGLTRADARFALQGTKVDAHGRQCPFGRRVVLQGPAVAGAKYRAWARKLGSASPVLLDRRIWVVDEDGNGSWHYAAGGWFSYLGTSLNFNGVLAYFDTGADDDGRWEIWLEVDDPAAGSVYLSPTYRARIDNTRPQAEITLTAGACKQFEADASPPVVVTGTFTANDPYFGRYRLEVLPSTLPPSGDPPNPASPSSGHLATGPTPDPWSLDTGNPRIMPPCGYVVRLHVWDRSIRNSAPNSHNYRNADVGFCLIA